MPSTGWHTLCWESAALHLLANVADTGWRQHQFSFGFQFNSTVMAVQLRPMTSIGTNGTSDEDESSVISNWLSVNVKSLIVLLGFWLQVHLETLYLPRPGVAKTLSTAFIAGFFPKIVRSFVIALPLEDGSSGSISVHASHGAGNDH